MQLLAYLKEGADSLESLVTFTSLQQDLSDNKDPFLELLEVIDVSSKQPPTALGEQVLADYLDIADCIVVNLDCIDIDIPEESLLGQRLKKIMSERRPLVVVLSDIEIMYDNQEDREEQVMNMRKVLRKLHGQDGELDAVYQVIGYSGNEGVRKVLKEVFMSSMQRL